MAKELAEAKKPHIAVAYYAPTFGTDATGEEVVYVLKQITWSVNLKNEDHFYLCSIKPDGSAHREICNLDRRDERQFHDLLWSPFDHMEICRPANLGVLGSEWEGGGEHILLFSLDGKTIQRLSSPSWEQNYCRPWRVGCPTLSPDGEWVAFVEEACADGPGRGCYFRIAKCRLDGSDYTVLTEFDHYRKDVQPAWSPNGDLIAYIHPRGYTGNDELRMMGDEGNIEWVLGNRFGFKNPRWSPDGNLVLLNGEDVVDVVSKNVVGKLNPPLPNSAKWGKSGYVVPQKDGVDFIEVDRKTVYRLFQNVSRPAKHGDIKKEEFRW
jgi:hypothetical protein